MINLKTKYLGLELKNPIIVGASNLVTDLRTLKRLEEAGAAAIVYKSLFEEQIQLETLEMDEQLNEYNDRHAEMTSLFPSMEHAGPKEHLMHLREAKKALNIPLIASLNAVYDVTWPDYAKQLEEAGVDALEINFFSIVDDPNKSADAILAEQINTIHDIKKVVKIPVSVKLSPFYTNVIGAVTRMDNAGADGFVMFNRLFEPSIDVDHEKHHFPWNLSNEGDNRLALRYAGMLHGNIKADICSNTGILRGTDAIQMILAGANTVQVVSALYKNKIEYLGTILHEMEDWMKSKNYKSLDEFRGKLSRKNVTDPYAYKRAQYVDILWHSERIFNRYPKV